MLTVKDLEEFENYMRSGDVLRFVADDVYGQRFDAGIFGIEHCSDCLTDDKDAHFLSPGQVPEPIKRPEPSGLRPWLCTTAYKRVAGAIFTRKV